MQTERNAEERNADSERWHFTTRRPISMAPPSPTPHPHKNHQVTALGRAESTRGLLAATFSAGENLSFGAFGGGTIEVCVCFRPLVTGVVCRMLGSIEILALSPDGYDSHTLWHPL